MAVENRRGADGWLCSAAEHCDEPATLQAAASCNGCGAVVSDARAALAARDAEKATQQCLLNDLADRCATEERSPTADELVAASIAQTAVVRLSDEIRRLGNVATTHDVEHTHPVFACAGHEHLI